MRGARAWLRSGALLVVLVAGGCGGGGSGVGVGTLGNMVDGGAGGLGGSTAGSSAGSTAGAPGDGGIGVADGGSGIGTGSGGTGISGGGVGSGGTGATADASGVGSVDGFGSIIVNGVRYDIAGARVLLSDVMALRLGMTVRVSGPIDTALAEGTATTVVSAADLRGPVDGLDGGAGRFRVFSVQVTTDPSTAYGGGLASAADLRNGDTVQVHGLPGAGGQLRATRIERIAAGPGAILSGEIAALDTRAQTFRIGSQQVRYAGAMFDPAAPAASLAAGQTVRVRAGAPATVLQAASVEPWYPLMPQDGKRLSLSGLVTDFASLRALRVDGLPVDASGARISGGPASDLANGARVEAAGTVRSGVLVASRVTLRHGSAAPTTGYFTARGSVGAYRSAASFKVQGQDIDASGPGVVFTGGTAADLGPSRKVQVTGSRVVDDVLVADRVDFLP